MKTKINDYDWERVQQYYNQYCSQKRTMKYFSICRTVFQKAKKLKKIICDKRPKHTETTKKKISRKRKNYLKNKNHPWRRRTKFYSPPCELFKQFLRQNNINFCQQYMNHKEWKRNFAIDIAFPNEKIGIEINGNQHYQSNGQLKKYYQERHDILEGFGWKIFEIPYLMVWNEDFKSDILKQIKQHVNIGFDYSEYIKQKLQQKENRYICVRCGAKKKTKESKMCPKCACICSGFLHRKAKRPPKEVLEKEIQENSFLALGRKYGVSDNAIRKWCKNYNMDYKKIKQSYNKDIGFSS